MGTLNGVSYVEVNPGEQAVASFDGVTKPRAFLIAWSDVDDFIEGLLGSIHRTPEGFAFVRGMAYEDDSPYRALTVRIAGVGKPFEGGSGFIAYPKARVHVSFGVPQVERSEELDGESWADEIEEELHLEFLTVPGKYLKYGAVSLKSDQAGIGAIPYQAGTLTLRRKNWNVPGFAASNVTVAEHFAPFWGKTNSDSFMGQPAGTLLLGGYHATPQVSYDTDFGFGLVSTCDLTVTLLIKKPGWNRLFIPGDDDDVANWPGWQTVHINVDGAVSVFPETSFRDL